MVKPMHVITSFWSCKVPALFFVWLRGDSCSCGCILQYCFSRFGCSLCCSGIRCWRHFVFSPEANTQSGLRNVGIQCKYCAGVSTLTCQISAAIVGGWCGITSVSKETAILLPLGEDNTVESHFWSTYRPSQPTIADANRPVLQSVFADQTRPPG